jgi:hypothetical protein
MGTIHPPERFVFDHIEALAVKAGRCQSSDAQKAISARSTLFFYSSWKIRRLHRRKNAARGSTPHKYNHFSVSPFAFVQ